MSLAWQRPLPARGPRLATSLAPESPSPAAAPPTPDLIVDAGAGVGAAGLAAALRNPAAQLDLLEIDPQSCALAREDIVLNGLERRGRKRAGAHVVHDPLPGTDGDELALFGRGVSHAAHWGALGGAIHRCVP